ncbi:MPT63 family protein [Mycobacterium sp. URHB0044]|uniref:MPT63 family protein n=1 Tax=Mycobacterium sp. URHB0044 TaxID=1380386 RepID=UPI00048EE347|nr:MPT63 family protein [Mycobacterium sp. URHB0044]
MKISHALAAAAAVATAGSVGILGAPIASADPTTTTIGSQAKLVDGNVVQAWTITNLKPSSDAIPYPVAGTLWEATATDEALEGGATPIVSNLNARAKSGETYRVLFGVATPQGVNPSTLAQGEKTTGKVYFDVTGDKPDSVVYNAGGQDLLVWVEAPPPARQGGTQWTPAPSRGQTSPAPAATPATPAPAASPTATGTEGAPLPASGAQLPTGSSGTPLPVGTPATPLPTGSQGTPLPAGSQGTPAVAGTEGAPLPASAQEAPALAPAPAVAPAPAPAVSQGTPLPAGSQGTPATPTTTTIAPPPPGS